MQKYIFSETLLKTPHIETKKTNVKHVSFGQKKRYKTCPFFLNKLTQFDLCSHESYMREAEGSSLQKCVCNYPFSIPSRFN